MGSGRSGGYIGSMASPGVGGELAHALYVRKATQTLGSYSHHYNGILPELDAGCYCTKTNCSRTLQLPSLMEILAGSLIPYPGYAFLWMLLQQLTLMLAAMSDDDSMIGSSKYGGHVRKKPSPCDCKCDWDPSLELRPLLLVASIFAEKDDDSFCALSCYFLSSPRPYLLVQQTTSRPH